MLIGWVFFRAETLPAAGAILKAMFGFAPGGLAGGQALYYLKEFKWELLLAIPAALPLKVWLQGKLQKKEEGGGVLARWTLTWGVRILALGVFFLSFLTLLSSSFNPFIYFRF